MNNILGRKVDLTKAIIGAIIVSIGFLGLLFAPAIISIFSLTITGILLLILVYGKKNVAQIFSRPISPFKNIIKYFFLNLVVSMGVALILKYALHWTLQSNPVNEGFSPLLFITIPIMLLGEELFSIYFLSIFSSKFNLSVASILSAVIFGLVHFSTYYSGNIFHTLVHILLIQGVARIIFNQAAIKSNSIITSWIVHVLFDFSTILIVLFFS
ncbi:CPBP family intramembrane metalloprotease [Enterococcus durans]|uniref:CPBP family glutamic-type intramembrane protease n=1 Tax=Enterococcus durans TaxID=53345 RepID=UPI001248C6D9|nr:CPBP family glutamic-type intramembrane protease [Enterococcus durans]KAA9215702.1 CPBP family intramembrane metalloprotease [Enterococcus durans]